MSIFRESWKISEFSIILEGARSLYRFSSFPFFFAGFPKPHNKGKVWNWNWDKNLEVLFGLGAPLMMSNDSGSRNPMESAQSRKPSNDPFSAVLISSSATLFFAAAFTVHRCVQFKAKFFQLFSFKRMFFRPRSESSKLNKYAYMEIRRCWPKGWKINNGEAKRERDDGGRRRK